MSEVNELKDLISKQQQQIEQLMKMFPQIQNLDLSKQGRVDTPPEDDSLLEIDPESPSLIKGSASNAVVIDEALDVGEEVVEDDEPETVVPKVVKDTSLMDVEILEEGDSGGGRGNRACVRVPLSRSPRKNRFRDNPAFAKIDTLKFDKVVRTEESVRAHEFIEKRPPAIKVVVSCRECKRKFRIDAKLAPQRIEAGDTTSYQCDGCILSRKG